jgi:hypothetical protein
VVFNRVYHKRARRMHLAGTDLNLHLHTIRVTAKPDLGFYPKRWEEREVPVPKHLIELLASGRIRED